jgi:Astacin (Peptidase family M12A)/Repeat of unknown function (DUF5648)
MIRRWIEQALIGASLAGTVLSSTLAAATDATEVQRTLWRGKWVNYVERGDFAVMEGDIIIGHKDIVRKARLDAEKQLASGGAGAAKALTVDSAAGLWTKAASGVVEVPYTIEAGDSATINAAIAEINRLLAGALQWVPRAAQTDYVAFNIATPNAGFCASALGRSGGRQTIFGDPTCNVGVLIHEMGHAMGLLHVQADINPAPFIDTRLSRIPPPNRGQSDQQFYSRTLNGYDYASIMHYGRSGFIAYADPINTETKPLGIDIGYPPTFSTADVDALKRLYAAAPAATTIVTHPAGLNVIVDGVTVTTPVTYNWPLGSVHRIWVPQGLQTLNGYQFGFGRWSHDASAVPAEQLTWQVIPGDGTLGAPLTAPLSTVLTANFVRLMTVNMPAATQAGGTVTVTPRTSAWKGTTDLFPQYSVFDIRANPNAGFLPYFTSAGPTAVYGGGLGPSPTTFLLGPSATHTIGAAFHSGNSIALAVTGDGMTDNVSVTVTPPSGTATRTIAPRLSRDTAGVWKYAVSSPQTFSDSGRYVLDGIDGLDNATTGEVTMPTSGSRTVTIRAHKEWTVYRQVIPGCAGSISINTTGSFTRVGTALTATVTPVAGGVFLGWSGSASGTGTTTTSTVSDVLPEFVATFNSVAAPLTLTGILPPNFGDDATTSTLTLTGTGFTPESRVSVNAVLLTPQFVDSNTLRITVSRTDLPFVGRLPVYVFNRLSVSCPVNSNSLAIDVLPAGQKVALSLTEYYHAGLDYYFLTGREGDKAALDQVPAFARTGKEIKVFAKPNLSTLPLERHFFANVARGGSRGAHFFTALPSDQALLTSLNPTNQPLDAKPFLEGVEGYAVPKLPSGQCPAGTAPIYRAFKGQPRYVDDGNHRFSTSLAQHQDMVNRLGWTDEGVVFCGVQ